MQKMHHAIENMLTQYQCASISDYTHALKEIIQQITLLGLWRAKFFEKGAFYGGTALRILYGLNRFSEDLDFSLLNPDIHFKLEKYNEAITAELQSFGFQVQIENKEKILKNNIQAAFVKVEAKQQLINVVASAELIQAIHRQQKIKIKMEVDIDPPLDFETDTKPLLNPIPFSINTFQPSSLFASKIHALLCRTWNARIKGRDWFDFVWYISQRIPLCLLHLKARLVKSGDYPSEKMLGEKEIKELLRDKIYHLDIELAKQDVLPFVRDKAGVDIWSRDFFLSIVEKMNYNYY